jgi:cell division protein FtsQ
VLAVLTTVGGVLLVTGASIALAWAGRRHLLTSARFAITAIAVDGNERRSEAELVAESGLLPGANAFAVDLDAARARLLTDPWITEATLVRRLPGTILVHVTERRAAALLALGDTFLATVDGVPFKKLEPGDPIDLPLVTGLRPEDVARDRAGATRAVRVAIDVAAEYERGPIAARAPLEEVHIEPDDGVVLYVGRNATELALGGPPFRRKLEEAARVFAEVDKRGGKADAVMLDNNARPERVVVRMR